MTADAPVYPHDCRSCVFLGHIACPDLGACDLYACPQELGGPTVVARFGPGSAYTSGLCFIRHRPALEEAARRAVARGLLELTPRTGAIGQQTVGTELDIAGRIPPSTNPIPAL